MKKILLVALLLLISYKPAEAAYGNCAFGDCGNGSGSASVSDSSYSASWDGDTTNAPSKNSVYDKIETLGGVSGFTDGGTNVYTTTTTDQVAIGTTTPNAQLMISNVSTADSFRIDDALGDTTPLIVSSNGNVGIGTINPAGSIHIQDSGTLRIGDSTSTNDLIISQSNGATYVYPFSADGSTRTAHTFSTTGHSGTGGVGTIGLAGSSSSAQTGSGSFVRGVSGTATNVNTSGTVDNAYGVFGNIVRNGAGGTTTNGWAIYGSSATTTAGTLTRSYAGGFNGWVGVGGNVGIGTSIAGNYVMTPPPSGGLIVEGNTGIGTHQPVGRLNVVGEHVRIGNGGTNDNATSTGELYVQGDMEVDGTIYGSGAGITGLSSGGWTDGGTNIYLSTTTDSVAIGTTTPSSSTTFEIMKQSSNAYMKISSSPAATADTLIVTSAGNFGIGSNSPGNKLSVGGDVGATQFVGIGTTQTTIQFMEASTNGSNTISFTAPSAITSDVNCVLENDSSPIPDSCVGDGTDGGSGSSQWQTTAGIGIGTYDPIGIGTYKPRSSIDIQAGAPRIIQFDNDAAISSTNPAWSTRSQDGTFKIQQTTDYSAYNDHIAILPGGNVGFGTTNPRGGVVIMNGNVGIGTYSPQGALQVVGSGAVGIGTTSPDANNAGLVVMFRNVGIGTINPGAALDIQRSSGAIRINGNVGISTTKPNPTNVQITNGIITTWN